MERIYLVFHTSNKNENHFAVKASSRTEAKELARNWVKENTKGYTFFNIWKWKNINNTNYDFMDYSEYVNEKGNK